MRQRNILALRGSMLKFSILKSSTLTESVFFLSLQRVFEVVRNNPADNLPLDSEMIACRYEKKFRGNEIESEEGKLKKKRKKKASSSSFGSVCVPHLCYQELHVVACLNKGIF